MPSFLDNSSATIGNSEKAGNIQKITYDPQQKTEDTKVSSVQSALVRRTGFEPVTF